MAVSSAGHYLLIEVKNLYYIRLNPQTSVRKGIVASTYRESRNFHTTLAASLMSAHAGRSGLAV